MLALLKSRVSPSQRSLCSLLPASSFAIQLMVTTTSSSLVRGSSVCLQTGCVFLDIF
jgi:hypothetical protein